jgi:drug/metabolite transporter (DMT)-like permease
VRWLLVALMVTATVASDVLQSFEMKRSGEQSIGASGVLRLLRLIGQRKFLILAIGCLAVSFFSFMALVEIAPLSFAVPASAASYVFETALAKFVLKERVGARRIAGTLIVLAGVALIGG